MAPAPAMQEADSLSHEYALGAHEFGSDALLFPLQNYHAPFCIKMLVRSSSLRVIKQINFIY